MKKSCKEETSHVMPFVDFNKCEAKGPCIKACPYQVFEMKSINNEEFSKLSFFGKLKTKAHGLEKAFVIKPEECHNCGLCVSVCPEKAIQLIPFSI